MPGTLAGIGHRVAESDDRSRWLRVVGGGITLCTGAWVSTVHDWYLASSQTSDVGSEQAVLTQTERWFLRRGLPHFIEDYRASDDVLTRIVPLLTFVFVVEIAGAANLEWTWWQNALAVVAAVVAVVAGWAAVNRSRGLPALRLPATVGAVELTTFVVVPASLPLVFGGQVGAAVLTMLGNLALVAVAALVASYGLVPMSRWAFGQTCRQIGDVVDLFARSLPLLLLFALVLFINTEVWQVAASLDGFLFWVSLAFFVVIGLTFLLIRLPRELDSLRDHLGGDAAVEACSASPLSGVAVEVAPFVRPEPMSRRQQFNALLVLLFSQAIQVFLVSLSIVAFFVVFGVIVMQPAVVDSWTDPIVADSWTWTWTWFGQDLSLGEPLLRVSGFLGALSGLYFTVYVITDRTYREEFFDEVVQDVRESIAVRNVYLAVRARAR